MTATAEKFSLSPECPAAARQMVQNMLFVTTWIALVCSFLAGRNGVALGEPESQPQPVEQGYPAPTGRLLEGFR